MRNALHALGNLIAAYWAAHTVRGKLWLTLGFIALVVDAALSYSYGIAQTTWHGIGFAVVAIVFSQLPDGAYEEWKKGHTVAASILGLLCVPLGAVAYQSHIGYGAGVRLGDIKSAMIQQTAYDDARGKVEDNAANLKMWKAQLAKLTEQNGWVATITADGLRSELKTADEAVKQEEARGGCGPICLMKMKARDEIAAKIAVAEQASDLTKRIEATQRLVDKYRVASAHTQAGMSSVAMQTDANTQIFGLVRAAWTGEPLEQAMKVTESSAQITNLAITALGSLGFMIMAPIGFFMAGRNRREDVEAIVPSLPAKSDPAKPMPAASHARAEGTGAAPVNGARFNHLTISDETGMAKVRQWIAEAADNSFGRLATS